MSGWPDQRLRGWYRVTHDGRQQAVHDAIVGGPRGGVRGPVAVWLYRPEPAARTQ